MIKKIKMIKGKNETKEQTLDVKYIYNINENVVIVKKVTGNLIIQKKR